MTPQTPVLARYLSLVGGSDPLQSYLHKRLAENLNSEAALGTVTDVAQCVQWVNSTFLSVRAVRDPRRYLGLPQNASRELITKKIEELCVKAMNGLASSGLITMDEASCIQSTDAGRLMSVYYIDLETMKTIMKINGSESLEKLLWLLCESHELSDMHLRVDERKCLNALNRNNAGTTIRFPMKGKISSRQMKLSCIIQAVLGCLPIPDPSLNQEAMKIMRIADRVCKCLVAYVTSPKLMSANTKNYFAVLNALVLAKCVSAQLWESSPYLSKQLKGIGPTFSSLLASAGKVNFMLLEETHPRDLERIMNKGPPAGNVLRKQISLLPKYSIKMTPLNAHSVRVELVLLNQTLLSENLDHLTAGTNHKFYLIVGDSDNNLLYLSSYKDKDLINVYDGCITCDVTRKQLNEHKVTAHCISSNFVGIDEKWDFVFADLTAAYCNSRESNDQFQEIYYNKLGNQDIVADNSSQRKRKNESVKSQSKEKIKRDTNVVKKFKHLKEYFGITSQNLIKDLSETSEFSNKILENLKTTDMNRSENSLSVKSPAVFIDLDNENKESLTVEISDNEVQVDEAEINNILKEIESEIGKHTRDKKTFNCNLTGVDLRNEQKEQLNIPPNNVNAAISYPRCQPKVFASNKGLSKKINNKEGKSNFSFIDKIEKKYNSTCETEQEPKKDVGFSGAIRDHVNDFLKKIQQNVKVNSNVCELLDSPQNKCVENIIPLDENNILLSKLDTEPSHKITKDEQQNKNNRSLRITQNHLLEQTSKAKEIDCFDQCKSMPSLKYAVNDKKINNNYKENQFRLFRKPPVCKENIFIPKLKNQLDCRSSSDEPNNYQLTRKLFNTSVGSNLAQHVEKLNATSVQNSNQINEEYISDVPLVKVNMEPLKDDILLCANKKQPNSERIQAENNNPEDYIKQFTYSATKINTCTKILPTCKVHIVSRVKVDLDVTEIKTKNENNNHFNQVIEFNDTEEVASNVKITEILSPNTINSICISNKTPMSLPTPESRQSEPEEPQSDHDILKNKPPLIERPLKVSDILQKYKNIIESRQRESEKINNNTHSNINKNELNKTPHKTKRKYKICDLHKVDIPLPESLTSILTDSKKDQPSQETSLTQEVILRKIKHANMLNNNIEKTQSQMIHEIQSPKTNCILPFEEIDIPEATLNISPELQSELNNSASPMIDMKLNNDDDVDINQAILDPRTFLETTLKDNMGLIPPPPEFCDTGMYSPINDTDNIIDDTNISDQFTNDCEMDTNISQYSDINMYVSNINDYSSQGIETWTFDKEGEDHNSIYIPPRFSNFATQSSTNPSQSLSQRRQTLNRFKFTKKRNNYRTIHRK